MNTRLSIEELENIERMTRNGFPPAPTTLLVAEVRASWADSAAARRALRDLLDSHWAHHCSDGVGGCTAVSWEKFCDAWDVLHPENPSVDYDYDAVAAASRADQ